MPAVVLLNKRLFQSMCVITAIWMCQSARAQPANTPIDKFLQDLEKRQRRISAIKCEITAEMTIPKMAYFDPAEPSQSPKAPPRDIHLSSKRDVLLDFRGNRHRLSIEQQSYDFRTDTVRDMANLIVYDGKALKGRLLKNDRTDLVTGADAEVNVAITRGWQGAASFDAGYAPLFFVRGVVPYGENVPIPGALTVALDREFLSVHGRAVHQSRNCTVLRTHVLRTGTTSFEEFWVDSERDSAIVRLVSYLNDLPQIDLTVTYDRHSGEWLPKRWRTLTYNYGKVSWDTRFDATSFEINPSFSEDSFELKEKSGDIVRESNSESPQVGKPAARGSRYYRIEANGNRTELVTAGDHLVPTHSALFWMIASIVASLAVIVLIAWQRNHRRRLHPS